MKTAKMKVGDKDVTVNVVREGGKNSRVKAEGMGKDALPENLQKGFDDKSGTFLVANSELSDQTEVKPPKVVKEKAPKGKKSEKPEEAKIGDPA